jgi:UDP-galactopyranose mutase
MFASLEKEFLLEGDKTDFQKYSHVIVGSGLFGLTIAERLANRFNSRVLIMEKRSHIGGNAYSEFDLETGIEVHKYGSHIFHTSNETVWEYVNQFTKFTSYVHRVKSLYNGEIYSLPINLHTINQFLKSNLTPDEARQWVADCATEVNVAPKNLEEKAISLIGRPLYEAFIKGYTAKQWETNPTELPVGIISRLPVRYNYDGRYFNDKYEGLPVEGYATWLTRMTKHAKIDVALNTCYFNYRTSIPKEAIVVYTGPIDRFFDYSEGRLRWRTLDFETSTLDTDDFQGASVINYAEQSTPYTRIHEFKHFHPERTYTAKKTIITKEHSRVAKDVDEPYYPINTDQDRQTLNRYRQLSKNITNTYFGGRLGSYKYLDMGMAIASAINLFENKLSPRTREEN